MISRFLTTASIVTAVALAPAERAEADAADFIGGAILGGVIGHALTQGNRTTTTTRVVRPTIPVTQQGRETQAALNYFGFQAGAVDGQVGAGTRSAIERYQRVMGYPVNGREFSSYQFDYLMDAFYWAQNGGAAQTRLGGTPLLFAYRDALQGNTLPAVTTAPVGAQPPATTVIVNPQPLPNVQPAPGVTAASQPTAIPNLFANAAPQVSLANTCNGVMLRTSTNGGYITQATMTDPGAALSEQFCVARTYAMAQGEALMQNIVGLSQAQIAEQCVVFSQSLAANIDRVSITGQAVLEGEIRAFAAGSGMQPGDLVSTARVCLSVGYAQDDMRMAVGSALILASMGEPVYGELLGHHLREGFGTDLQLDLAMGWYNSSLNALEQGAPPVFMPGQPERTRLLRQATLMLQIGQPTPVAVPASQTGGTPLPTFSVNQ